jgi:hypothetical protein
MVRWFPAPYVQCSVEDSYASGTDSDFRCARGQSLSEINPEYASGPSALLISLVWLLLLFILLFQTVARTLAGDVLVASARLGFKPYARPGQAKCDPKAECGPTRALDELIDESLDAALS